MPEQYREELPGGIRYTAMCDPKFRSIFLTVQMTLRRDAQTVPVYALLTDLLTESSQDHPSGAALSLRLGALYAADLFGRLDVIGDNAVLSFSASWLDDRYALEHEPVTAEMLDLVTGCLLRPNARDGAFCDPEFRICKQNLLDDIDCERNDKREYALQKASELAYCGEPAAYSLHGSKADAEAVTAAYAFEVWQKILKTADIAVYCVSPEPKPEIAAHLRQAFGALQRTPQKAVFPAPSPCKAEPAVRTDVMPAEQARLVAVYKYGELSYEALYMVCSLLGGISDSLLFTAIREEQQLCYYILLQSAAFKHAVYIDCGTDTDQLEQAQQGIAQQISRLCSGDFPDDLPEKAVLRYERLCASGTDSASGTASAQITRDRRQDHRSPAEFAAALRGLTKADIMLAAAALRLDTVYMLCAAEGEDEP